MRDGGASFAAAAAGRIGLFEFLAMYGADKRLLDIMRFYGIDSCG